MEPNNDLKKECMQSPASPGTLCLPYKGEDSLDSWLFFSCSQSWRCQVPANTPQPDVTAHSTASPQSRTEVFAGDSVLMGTAMHHPMPWRTNPWISFTKGKRVFAFSWSLHQVSVYWQPTGRVSKHFRNPIYNQRGAEIISQKFQFWWLFFFFFLLLEQTNQTSPRK